MNGRVISVIYFYLVSIIGIILLIIGTHNAVTFAVNSTQFEKYPLQWGGGEDRCSYPMMMPENKSAPSNIPQPTDQDKKSIEEQKKSCLASLESERKLHKVNNLKDAITFTLFGVILFGSHFPLALRRSKEK